MDIKILTGGGYYPYGKEKSVCFTFDDCNWTAHRIALILRSLNVHATFFLNTKLVATKFHYHAQFRVMDWMGFEIGSHTRSHAVLTKVTPEMAESELAASKQDLERVFGKVPSVFSYPESSSTPETDALVYKYYHAIRYNTEIDRQQCYHIRTKTTSEDYHRITEDFVSSDRRALVIGGHGVDGQGYESISSKNLITWIKALKRYDDKIWFAGFGELSMFETIKDKVKAKVEGNAIVLDTGTIRDLMERYPDTPFYYCVKVSVDGQERMYTIDLRKKNKIAL